MKKLTTPTLFSLILLLLCCGAYAQDPPEVVWDGFFPVVYVPGNFTANDVKQSPFGGYVMVGTRNMTYQGYGYW